MMGGILGAVFFTIILLTGNTMAQAFRERVPELAVLKTLGFSDAIVSLIVLGEAVVLCAVGGGIGLGIAALLAPGVARGIKDILPGFELVWQTIVAGLAIAVLLGLIVGAVPAADRPQAAHSRRVAGTLIVLGADLRDHADEPAQSAVAAGCLVGDHRRHRGCGRRAGVDPRDGDGFRAALESTGAPDRAIVLRGGSAASCRAA